MNLREHGADVYDASGRPRRVLDFSSTVASLQPPLGWRAAAQEALERLALYPQSRSLGLSSLIAKHLGLPAGSVLVGGGSLECLEWLARSAKGQGVLLDGPFFGEYLPLLQAAGAKPSTLGPVSLMERPRLAEALKAWKGSWVWTADPANPTGLAYEPAELAALLQRTRRNKQSLVLDQALTAQRLEPAPELAALAARTRGLYLVRSLSKGLGLPGLRLGYVIGHPKDLVKLLPYVRPWSVNSLAQALGAWALQKEHQLARKLPQDLRERKQDLWKRLEALRLKGAKLLASDTGYFLLQLPSQASAVSLAAKLEARGILVRSCHTYGFWGREVLRLNPRGPADNAKFCRVLKAVWGRR